MVSEVPSSCLGLTLLRVCAVDPAWEALGARGVKQASQGLGGWSWPMGTCQGLHLIGLPIAESTQATDPTSARILAAKRLSLSSPTSR